LPEIPVEGTDHEVVNLLNGFRQSVIDDPSDAGKWGALGEAFLANEFTAEALACLRRAQQLDEQSSRWPYLVGVTLEKTSPDESITCLRKAIANGGLRGPYLSAVRLRLAEGLARREEFGEARPLFEEERTRNVYPARAAYGLATTLLAAGDYSGCVRALEAVRGNEQARKKAASLMALAYRFLGAEDRAEQWQKQARAYPDDAPWIDPFAADSAAYIVGRRLRFQSANVLEQMGRLREAGELLAALAEDYPDARSYSALGFNLLLQQRNEEAGQAFRRTLALDPMHFSANYHLGLVLFRKAEKMEAGDHHQEALPLLREAVDRFTVALEEKPDHSNAHLLLGRSLGFLGHKEEEIAHLQRAVDVWSDNYDAHYYLGLALAEAAQKDAAIQHLREAQRLAPSGDDNASRALERIQKEEKTGTGPGQ
jgi:tetratricopeptide (TPR) repeat protein